MTLLVIGAFVLTMLGGIAMYSPWYFFENSEHMTGKDLGRRYPRFAWMRLGYPVMVLSVFAATVWVGGAFHSGDNRGIYAFAGALYTVTLLNGLAGLFMGVCPFFGEFRYLYVRDNHVHKVSLKLIAFGVLGLAGSWFLPMVLPSVKIF